MKKYWKIQQLMIQELQTTINDQVEAPISSNDSEEVTSDSIKQIQMY